MKYAFAFAGLLTVALVIGNSTPAEAGVFVGIGVPVPAPLLYPPPVPVVRFAPPPVVVLPAPIAPVFVARPIVPYGRWWYPGPYPRRYWRRW